MWLFAAILGKLLQQYCDIKCYEVDILFCNLLWKRSDSVKHHSD